jgi:mono/diheme cytochrome c family protein
MRHLHKIAATALMVAAGPALAVELGSELAGSDYAKKVCAECHEVGPYQSFSPNPDAPSFKEIADTQGMSARALGVWLQTSHPTMPDLIIKPDDMDNVIAYILSLRAKP